MKTLYIVRHGETEHNATGLVQGEDSVLSVRGEKQAESLAERFKSLDFAHIFASDYSRAAKTAERIAEATGKDLTLLPVLREFKRPSKFINQPNTSKEYLDFIKMMDEKVEDENWRFEDGENFFDMRNRVETFMKAAENRLEDEVAVTHARMVMLMTLWVVMGGKLPPLIWRDAMKNLVTSNTGITKVVFDDRYGHWRLSLFNDQAHFG